MIDRMGAFSARQDAAQRAAELIRRGRIRSSHTEPRADAQQPCKQAPGRRQTPYAPLPHQRHQPESAEAKKATMIAAICTSRAVGEPPPESVES